MLFVLVRIEFGTVSNFIVGKTLLTLPGFCVPHFDVSIVGAAQESITNVVEIRVTNGLPAKKGKVLITMYQKYHQEVSYSNSSVKLQYVFFCFRNFHEIKCQ